MRVVHKAILAKAVFTKEDLEELELSHSGFKTVKDIFPLVPRQSLGTRKQIIVRCFPE